jgi:quercetin dioxygenase-like cupin family protein
MIITPGDKVAWKETLNAGQRGRVASYIGTAGALAPGPQAFLVEIGGTIEPHFHDVDQFQVVVYGKGRLGKKALAPISIHYADAFTPYGPIISDDGLAYFTLRLAASAGFFAMPGSGDKRKYRQGRNISWAPGGDVSIAYEGGEKDGGPEDGLSMRTFVLSAGERWTTPPSDGGGQYFIVFKGSVTHGAEVLGEMSLIYIDPGDAAAAFVAGGEGAQVVLLQFPKASERPGSDPANLGGRTDYYKLEPHKDHKILD